MVYQYYTFYRNRPNFDAVVLRNFECRSNNEMIIVKSPENARGCYHLAGEFSCQKEVDMSDLETAVVGEQAMKKFESKYEGKFLVPKLVKLFSSD